MEKDGGKPTKMLAYEKTHVEKRELWQEFTGSFINFGL